MGKLKHIQSSFPQEDHKNRYICGHKHKFCLYMDIDSRAGLGENPTTLRHNTFIKDTKNLRKISK